MKFIGWLIAIAVATALFFHFVGAVAVYTALVVVGALFLGCLVPSPFRDNLRLGLGIRFGEAVNTLASDAERAEARVNALNEEIKRNQLKVSNLRGTLNHQKNNVLAGLKRDLDTAIGDYDLVEEEANKSPNDATLQQAKAEQLDKVEQARQAVEAQETVVASEQEARSRPSRARSPMPRSRSRPLPPSPRLPASWKPRRTSPAAPAVSARTSTRSTRSSSRPRPASKTLAAPTPTARSRTSRISAPGSPRPTG
jgi:hypothetical protein